MSETEREIASQPGCWREARVRAPIAALSLPESGGRAAVVGCGTSLYVAQTYAALREAAGQGETDAFAASEYPDARRYDRTVVISRSGTTTEIVRLLASLPEDAQTVGISAVEDSPIARATSASVILGFADETSVVQTRFATSALALLRATLDGDLDLAIAHAEEAVSADLPVAPAAFDHFVFLGHGWTVGLANEAALKIRETAQAHAESYPAMEYRHGPISLASASTLAWILGTPDPSVADHVRATGATVVERGRDPMAELILVQRMAVALARARGLDPDHPRHLTRSVVLSEGGTG